MISFIFVALPYLQLNETPLALLCRKARSTSKSVAQFTTNLLSKFNSRLLCLPMRVLTVGDGNLSFSLSLSRIMRNISINPSLISLTATTFDDQINLQQKHPESVRIIEKLLGKNVTVKHQINAISLSKDLGTFSIIVFNHPHLGIEDAACHRTLLAHFFHSCRDRLRSGGQIMISLVEGQPERWKLLEEGGRAGFTLIQTIPMNKSKFPEYEIKRTHSGKSFVSSHAKKQSNYSQSSTFFHFVRKSQISVYSNAIMMTKKRKRRVTEEDTDEEENDKRSRVSCTSAGTGDSSSSGSSSTSNFYTCIPCQRDFTTAQGLRTHTHQVHVLNLYSSAQRFQCSICLKESGSSARKFSSKRSLEQHVLAKHGADQTIQPHTKQYATITNDDASNSSDSNSSSSNNSSSNNSGCNNNGNGNMYWKCSICQNKFSTKSDYDLHLTKLDPIVLKPIYACNLCSRNFGDQRAMRQHRNFCGKKALPSI
jgi:hypothetical protein